MQTNNKNTRKLPFLSCIVTCYNLQNYIEEALLCVINQDYIGPMEIIVVDDASTDNSLNIINSILSKIPNNIILKTIVHKTNLGVAAAYNSAIRECSGEWLICFDGDDLFPLDRCSKTAELIMLYPDSYMIMSCIELINRDGETIGYQSFDGRKVDTIDELPSTAYYSTIMDRFYIACDFTPLKINSFAGVSAYRRCVHTRFGDLPEELRCAQDPSMAFRSVLTGPVIGGGFIACKYRSHANNATARIFNTDISGVYEMELYWTEKEKMNIANTISKISDLDKSLYISDFSEEMKCKIRCIFFKKLSSIKLRTGWWYKNVFQRTLYLIINWRSVDKITRKWALQRLLPLRIFSWLKANFF